MQKIIEDRYLTLDGIAKLISKSYPTVKRWKAAGKFGAPDTICGKSPMWKQSTIERKLELGQLAGGVS